MSSSRDMLRGSRNNPSRERFSQDRHKDAPAAALQGPRIALLLITLALVLLGVVMVFSASSVETVIGGDNALSVLIEQIVFVSVGGVCLVVLWKVLPYHIFFNRRITRIVWVVSFTLLALTAVMGTIGLGAKRWLVLGPVSIQSSEFAKIGFIITMVYLYNSLLQNSIGMREFLLKIGLCILIPMGMILLLQSDLGTTCIISVGIIAVLWLGEAPKKWMLVIFAFLILVVVAAIAFKGYRSDRFAYLDPWNDGEGGYGNGYQIIRSYYAFADGGLFGVGIGNSREKYSYLPEAETDFIFAIIAEELGFVGCVVVIALFIGFLVAGLRIARMAPDPCGVMLAGSCTIIIVFQAFLNISCVVGLLPTTGKPLPFISSGGSSLLASLIMVGLILSVSEGTQKGNIYRERRKDLVYSRQPSSSRR